MFLDEIKRDTVKLIIFKRKSCLKMRGKLIPMTQTKRVSQVRGYEHRRSHFKVLVACLLYVNFC